VGGSKHFVVEGGEKKKTNGIWIGKKELGGGRRGTGGKGGGGKTARESKEEKNE